MTNPKKGFQGKATELYAARHYHEYTSFGSDIDLRDDSNGPADGNCARGFIILDAGSGTLAVDLADGTSKTITASSLTAGAIYPVALRQITTSTDVGRVAVLW